MLTGTFIQINNKSNDIKLRTWYAIMQEYNFLNKEFMQIIFIFSTVNIWTNKYSITQKT